MLREHQYRLPLEAIIKAMHASPDLVSVQATFPALPRLTTEICRAELLIGPETQDPLHSCAIVTPDDHLLLQQQEASSVSLHLGDITWYVRAGTSPDARIAPIEHYVEQQYTLPLFNKLLGVPVRSVVSVSPRQMQSLMHPHKRVCALVGGTKTIGQIARLLMKLSQEIQHTVHVLHNSACYQALTILFFFETE